MATLPFQAFDADHHYYEAEDAFIRHVDRRMHRRCMQWAEVNGRKRLLVGGQVNSFIPNPTFDPVAKPGILDEYFRGKNPDGKDIRTLFGELDPIHPAYRNRDARLAQLDEQGLAGAWLFPTLAVGMEESLQRDREALCAAFEGFNRWLEEDWGFAYRDRLFAAPYIPLADPEWAVRELEWALGAGARMICMTPGPVRGTDHGNPADPIYDAFWARVNEAGIVLGIHSGDAGYNAFGDLYGVGGTFKAFDFDPTRIALSAAPVADKLAAMICQRFFSRFPKVRVATVECGSDWVDGLLKRPQEGVRPDADVLRARPGRAVQVEGLGLAVLRGRSRGAEEPARRRSRALRLGLSARRGPRDSHRLHSRLQGIRRGRDPSGHARERALAAAPRVAPNPFRLAAARLPAQGSRAVCPCSIRARP